MADSMNDRKSRFSPIQILTLGIFLLILGGSVLLSLPISAASGSSVGFVTAAFTATSSVCVTGLVVVPTGVAFSLFGQIVIILLIQVGGIGFMTMAAMLWIIIKRKITLSDRIVMSETYNLSSSSGVVRLAKNVFRVTLVCELLGALILSIRFIPDFGVYRGIWYSVFHSISAFCNAGIDILSNGDSVTRYVGDPLVCITLMALIILGGFGFAVILDLIEKRRFRKTRLHTKLVVVISLGLVLIGGVFFYICEYSNPDTLGDPSLNQGEKILAGFFQSVTTRTAGFNSIDQGAMTGASKMMSMILMFIGASSASTGGGIKTTTFALLLLTVFSAIRGKSDLNIGRRRISVQQASRAFVLASLCLILVIAGTMMLLISQSAVGTTVSIEDAMFECFSAFGTVGLTTGITPELNTFSRFVVMFLMFAGRVGPLTLMMAIAEKHGAKKTSFRLPEEQILIG